MNRIETIITGASALLLAAYHLHLYFATRRHPQRTAVGMTNMMRQKWVETITPDTAWVFLIFTVELRVMNSSQRC